MAADERKRPLNLMQPVPAARQAARHTPRREKLDQGFPTSAAQGMTAILAISCSRLSNESTGNRRRRLSRVASLRPPDRGGQRRPLRRQSLYRHRRPTSASCWRTVVRFLHHDVTSPLDAEVEQIFNLACPASPIHYQRNPIETTKTCVHGAINMLDLARAERRAHPPGFDLGGLRRSRIHPQAEGYWGRVNPIGPRSCYDEGKRCAETLFFDYRRQVRLDIKVARIFNTYGPRMHPQDGRVVSQLHRAGAAGQADHHLRRRQPDAQLLLCRRSDRRPGPVHGYAEAIHRPVNFGNPVEFTMIELAERVLKIVGGLSRLVYEPLPQDDPKQRCPDISLARARLDWSPKVPLEDGLKETVAYFRSAASDAVTSRPAGGSALFRHAFSGRTAGIGVKSRRRINARIARSVGRENSRDCQDRILQGPVHGRRRPIRSVSLRQQIVGRHGRAVVSLSDDRQRAASTSSSASRISGRPGIPLRFSGSCFRAGHCPARLRFPARSACNCCGRDSCRRSRSSTSRTARRSTAATAICSIAAGCISSASCRSMAGGFSPTP